MMDGFVYSLRICLREFQLMFSDAGVLVIMLAAPIVYPALYSLIYYPEVLEDMPIAVVDLSHSSDSREYTRNLDATPELKVSRVCLSMEDAIRLFKQREVRGIVQIPATFSSDLALHRQTTVSAYADMEYFLYYRALFSGASLVTLEEGKQIQVNDLMENGLTYEQALTTSEPLKLVDNAMANRAAGFASYGIPAALMLIIQQTLILVIGMMAGTARERHPMGTLVSFDRNRQGTFRLVLGKSAAYIIVYSLLCIYMLGMVPQWFGYVRMASLKELASLIFPFLLSTTFMGLALSVVFRSRESSMLLYLFTSIPLLFLSGIIWPLSNFSQIWLIVRSIFPSSNAMFGYIMMNSLGANCYEVRSQIAALWFQTGIYFILACIVYYGQVRYSEKMSKKNNPILQVQ